MIANGQMMQAGLAKIEAAKQDGSWDALNPSDNLEISEDLAKAFRNNRVAEKNFQAVPQRCEESDFAMAQQREAGGNARGAH